jgi:alcohol dehydrogenase (NADP+)
MRTDQFLINFILTGFSVDNPLLIIKGKTMQTLTFANNDQMPILGLGTWKSEPGEVAKAVREAIRIGYRHIDCASIYGNEAEIGEALEEAMQAGEVSREELWITSKLWNNAHARDQASEALRKTLQDLRLDFVDLYLIHWPVAIKPDVIFPTTGSQFLSLEEVPLTETWADMETCVYQGLTKHIGVSNFGIKNIALVSEGAIIKPEMNQVELHPYLQQEELLTYCRKHNIHLTAYSPLGSRDRPDVMKKPDELNLLENPVVMSIAQTHACTPAQVLLRWSIERDTAVIPKSVSPDRMAENFRVTELKLSGQDMAELAKLDSGFRYVHGEFWTFEGSPYTMESLWA